MHRSPLVQERSAAPILLRFTDRFGAEPNDAGWSDVAEQRRDGSSGVEPERAVEDVTDLVVRIDAQRLVDGRPDVGGGVGVADREGAAAVRGADNSSAADAAAGEQPGIDLGPVV